MDVNFLSTDDRVVKKSSILDHGLKSSFKPGGIARINIFATFGSSSIVYPMPSSTPMFSDVPTPFGRNEGIACNVVDTCSRSSNGWQFLIGRFDAPEKSSKNTLPDESLIADKTPSTT